MTKRITLQTVIVVRDGKTFAPKIGEEFDYTDGEIKDLEAANPNAISRPTTTAKAEPGEKVESKVKFSGKKGGTEDL